MRWCWAGHSAEAGGAPGLPGPRAAWQDRPVHASAQAVATILARVAPTARVVELEASTRTAAEAADALGCPVGAIANSLVFMAGDVPVLVMTSGAHRVDTAALEQLLGLGPVRRASSEEVRSATGQPIGGVAPVGHPEPLRALVDVDLAAHGTVWAAAGTPHAVFSTTFHELLAITGGRAARVA